MNKAIEVAGTIGKAAVGTLIAINVAMVVVFSYQAHQEQKLRDARRKEEANK
jgi:hypothetical protein